MFYREDNNYLIGCSTNSGSDTQDHEGIVDGHAYTVLGCVNDAAGIPGIDLIKVFLHSCCCTVY